MTQYLLSIYQPAGPPPDPEVLAQVGRDLHELSQQVTTAGSWVFTGGLHGPESATVVRPGGDTVTLTEGPYLEGSEHIGGLWIISAADQEHALEFAHAAAAATGLPVEVRPFQDAPEG
jgi:hypothetical protein